jgi:hypothetical protein
VYCVVDLLFSFAVVITVVGGRRPSVCLVAQSGQLRWAEIWTMVIILFTVARPFFCLALSDSTPKGDAASQNNKTKVSRAERYLGTSSSPFHMVERRRKYCVHDNNHVACSPLSLDPSQSW